MYLEFHLDKTLWESDTGAEYFRKTSQDIISTHYVSGLAYKNIKQIPQSIISSLVELHLYTYPYCHTQ